MSEKHSILLTGGSGFIGAALLQRIQFITGIRVRTAGRKNTISATHESVFINSIDEETNWSNALNDIDLVIHTAARAHIMHDEVADPLAEYRKVNVDGALNLARQAAAAGVKRFIFVSSIKVNGEQTQVGKPFTAEQATKPQDPYGISKAEAEVGLMQIAKDTGMELVIIRPPLVYGAGVKGNFATLLNLAQKNLPLPLGAINNKRSLVALGNLNDLIVTCIHHPNAANQTFLVSDDHDVSTTELLKMLTIAAGKKPCLLPVPVSWLNLVANMTGKRAVIERLCGNLQLDITHTKNTLGWTPPLTVEEGMKCCFLEEDLC